MGNLPAYDLRRNEGIVIRVQPRVFKNRQFIDLRTYFVGDDGELSPTKKGLTVPLSLWPRFRALLAQVDNTLIQAGWLDREDFETM